MAKVSELTYPLVIAHRGAANLFPENTMAAFEGAAALGCQAIEAGDLHLLADGGLAAMHDATVDRTTDGSGNVADFTTPGIATLTVDSASWFGGRWADQRVPTFADILDRLGGRTVLVPESKATGAACTGAIVAAITARGLQDSVIVQSFLLSDIPLIAGAGIAAMYAMSIGTEATGAEIAAAGARFVIVSKEAPGLAGIVADLRAAGLKVLAYTVDSQVDYDAVRAAGCDGIFSNDPLYAARNYAAYRRPRAPWPSDGTYSHGMLVYPGVGPLTGIPTLRGGRGPFLGSPGAWRWALDSTPYLVGPVCPVPDAAGTYGITAKLVFDTPPSADRACWGGLYFGVDTDICPDDDDPRTGYLVAQRLDGGIEAYAQPPDSTGLVSLGTLPASAIVTPELSSGLAEGTPLAELPVAALPSPLHRGHQFVLPTGQVATLSAPAAAGATSLRIDRLSPSAPLAAGALLKQQVTLAIAKTAEGFTVSRTDDGVSAGYLDLTWHGGYVLLRNGSDDEAAISCSALTVT